MTTTNEANVPSVSALPEVYRNVIIITPHFRCMGFLDKDGHWRGMAHDEISDVISWEELNNKKTAGNPSGQPNT